MVNEGLTLRDYFAAKAMIGLAPFVGGSSLTGRETSPEAMAGHAYEIADALLAQRVKP